MSEQIIIEYGAKIDKLQADLRKVEQAQMGIDKGAKKSNKSIKDESEKAAKGVNKVGKEVNHLDGALKKVGGMIAGVFAVGQIIELGKKIIQTTAEFQKFEAVLVNTLGSKSEAQKSMGMIKDFAAKTPFGVAGLTSSFVKLVNQGFKPTAVEMRKLGDIAASQGKSFDQLTEGIIDAQTGEFERLKEFGIRASKEGDKVKFTFKGVQTQTDFTADAIQKYVLGLGDAVGVSGSMAAISNTVGGQISNLDDSFDSLFNTIGSGNTGAISTSIRLLNDLVQGIELVFTTQEQIAERFRLKEATMREEQHIGFLEQDIKNLTAPGEKAADIRRLVYAAEIVELEKTLVEQRRTLANHQRIFGEFISEPQKEVLDGFQADINHSETMINRLSETITKLDKEKFGASVKTDAQIEKEFKAKLDLLKKEEEIAIRRAELADKSEAFINGIQQSYNGKRILLFEEYNKQKDIEYKEFFLIAQELEKEHTEWLKKEEEKRQAEIIKRRDEILSIMDKSFKDEANQTRAVYNDQLTDLSQRYMQGMITRAEFEQQSNDMTIAIQKEGIKDEIDLINQKLAIDNLSYDQRVDLEGALIDKKKELNKIELDDFTKKEDEKVRIAEERQKQIKEIAQSGIDLIGKALQGFNDLQAAAVRAEIEEERALVDAQTNDLLANLNRRKEGGLLTEKQFAQEKARIDKERLKKESELKKRQFEAEKQANLTRIAIETAVSVAKTAATAGYPAAIPLIALALAQGALQAGLVASQPTPKFKDGVIDYRGKGTTTSDSNTVQISNRESVIKAKQSMKHTDALRAIQGDYFDRYINDQYLPKIKKKEAQRAAIREEREQAQHSWMKSMQMNGMIDTSHLERLTKKNKSVSLENADYIVSGVGREFDKAIKNNSYMK